MNIKSLLFETKFRNKGKNNILYVVDCEKKNRRVLCVLGCKIKICGNNNTIIIGKNTIFKKSEILIDAEDSQIIIGNNCQFHNLKIYLGGKFNKVEIGDNFSNTENCNLYAGGGNQNIFIGNNCLFSRNINIYAHDGHPIYSKDTDEVINSFGKPVEIGNYVWIGHGVYISKGVKISDNSIVGLGSVVTKRFEDTNVIIAGNPATIVKKNIYFKK